MRNELMHYGVLGMKWGVRRSPIDKTNSRDINRRSKLSSKAKLSLKRGAMVGGITTGVGLATLGIGRLLSRFSGNMGAVAAGQILESIGLTIGSAAIPSALITAGANYYKNK